MHKVLAATYTVAELLPTPLEVPDVINTVSWENSDTAYPNDDDKRLVNIGFSFTFKNTSYSQLRILTNGVLHFGADQRFHRVYNNTALPTNSADRFIAPYWDDLVDDAQSSVTYGSRGSAPFRSFIVTWTNVRAYANNLRYDFQVVLYENGDIRFRYANNTANGISATIGIEVDNSDFTQYSVNSSSVRTDFDLFFKNTLLTLPEPVLESRLDEMEWNGVTGEVVDRSRNGLNGTVFGGALNTDSAPALSGNPGTCRYADFNGNNQYISIPHNAALNQTGSFTVAAWIKIDALPASGLKTIISKDENYEFHVKPNGSINWWWQTVTPNATQQFDSTGTVTPGRWTHVAIRYQASNQQIFINGGLAGSASFAGTPQTNSDPLQIGADQGIAGRYFEGDIDEVRVFNVALSDAQLVTLATETHFCALANPGCSAAFPDALSSHSDGTLNFTESGNLVNSPDNVLQFLAITPTINSYCNNASCSADPGNPASEINFGRFPDTSVFTRDFSVSNNQSATLGNASQNEFDDVVVGTGATLEISAARNTYYIDDLFIQRDAIVNLRPGDYWIRSFRLERNVKINVVGSGTARLLIRDGAAFDRDTWLNANDSLGLTGDPGKLLVYSEGNISFSRNTRAWAAIYSQGNITLDRDSQYTGGMTANDISINRNTTINYDAAAMTRLDFGNLCQGSSCNLGGFQITQPAVALACPQARAAVSFQAICDDGSTPKTDYAGTVSLSSNESSLSQFFATATSSAPIGSISLNGSESGAGTIYLYHRNENNSLRVTLTDTAVTVSSSANQGTDFRSSGFAVTSPVGFSCGTTQNLTLTAIGQQDNLSGSCSVLTGFSGTKALSVWARVNYDVDEVPPVADALVSPFMLNGASITTNSQTSANLSLNFNAGQANVALQHLNSVQVLGLEFAHDDGLAGTPELRGSSAAMIISPERLRVSTPSPASACPSADHTCTPFVSAGSDFDLNVAAVCADPSASVATAYRTPAAQNIALNLNLVAPAAPNGQNGALSVNQIGIAAANNGQTTLANQRVSEVGVFTIDATAPAYFGRAVASGMSASIGRFFPHRFELSLSPADFSRSCNNFSYLDQGFFFNGAPQLRIEAKNAANQITQNYEGNFWKLGANLQEQGDCNGVSSIKGFCYADNIGGSASLWAPNGSQSYGDISNTNGVLLMTLHNQPIDIFRYQRPTVGHVQPFDADVRLTVELDDGDATGTQTLANIGFVGDSDTGGANLNQTNDSTLRHGRWKMENAFGPETENLAIKAHAQYYSLANRFVINPDDNCSVFNNSNILLNPSGSAGTPFTNIPLGSGSSNFSANSPLALGEDENFRLSRPGAGNVGEIAISVDLSSQPWLRYDWNGDGGLEDHPSIKASFGQYRGHDRIIYWREVNN